MKFSDHFILENPHCHQHPPTQRVPLQSWNKTGNKTGKPKMYVEFSVFYKQQLWRYNNFTETQICFTLSETGNRWLVQRKRVSFGGHLSPLLQRWVKPSARGQRQSSGDGCSSTLSQSFALRYQLSSSSAEHCPEFCPEICRMYPPKSLTEVQRVKPADSRNPETQQNPFKNTIPKQQIIFQVDNGCICGLCGHTWIFSVSLKSPRLTFRADTLYFPMRTG